MKVLGICGSLRKASYNAMALRAAQKLAPAGISVEVADISRIPLYNDDIRTAGEPAEVAALKAQVRAADAVLLVSPEYNFSVPGVLKNVLDWMSRPPEPPFDGKPAAIMGASPGNTGTARAQYHLRQILVSLNALVINRPEVMIGQAASRFDAAGKLTDETSRKLIADLLTALRDWTLRLRR